MPSRAGGSSTWPSDEPAASAVSNLVAEILLRLSKAAAAALLGALVYWLATALFGAVGSVELALLAWLAAAAFILLVEESPI